MNEDEKKYGGKGLIEYLAKAKKATRIKKAIKEAIIKAKELCLNLAPKVIAEIVMRIWKE